MGASWVRQSGGMVVALALIGLMGQACSAPPQAVSPTTEAALPSPKSDVAGFVKDEAKCHGTLLSKFTPKELGDAPEPTPSLVPTHPMITSVHFYHCMENDIDPSQQYPVGIEVATLKNGMTVIIRHSGFEYLSQRWTVILPEDRHSVTDTSFWLKQVDALTSELMPLANEETRSMLGYVHQALTDSKAPLTAFETEKNLSIGKAGDFNSTVSVVRAWQMTEKQGRAVEFSVNYGPL